MNKNTQFGNRIKKQIHRYLCEEWIRFVKTACNLEDIRCLNWLSLTNVAAFVLFVNNMLTKRFGFSAQTIKTSIRCAIMVFTLIRRGGSYRKKACVGYGAWFS